MVQCYQRRSYWDPRTPKVEEGALAAQVCQGAKEPQWVKKSRSVRDSLNIAAHINPLTKKKACLKGVPSSPRMVEVLNISEAVRLASGLHRLATDPRPEKKLFVSPDLCLGNSSRGVGSGGGGEGSDNPFCIPTTRSHLTLLYVRLWRSL